MTVPMALLGLLDAGPSHGFALKAHYDSLLGQGRALQYGQVYSTLARLERDGLIEGVGFEHGEGADRRMYAITPQGVDDFDTWLTTPTTAKARPSELFTKVILALTAGRSADDVLAVQRDVYLDRMRELTQARHGADAIQRLAGDYEIAHLEADLNWIELAGARLATLATLAPLTDTEDHS
jgi:DNA-binding PadR family transcriptional regulator